LQLDHEKFIFDIQYNQELKVSDNIEDIIFEKDMVLEETKDDYVTYHQQNKTLNNKEKKKMIIRRKSSKSG